LLARDGNGVANRFTRPIDKIQTAITKADDYFARTELRAKAHNFAPTGVALIATTPIPEYLGRCRTDQADKEQTDGCKQKNEKAVETVHDASPDGHPPTLPAFHCTTV